MPTDPRSKLIWDAAAARYRDRATGRFVTRKSVAEALNRAITAEALQMAQSLKDLAAKRLSLDSWYVMMRQSIKMVHLWAGAAGKGGWAQLTAEDYGTIGATVRFHYERLAKFAQQLSLGLPITARELVRVGMYAQAARATFNTIELTTTLAAGFTEERNVLDPAAEHCVECVELSARGWVPIGTLPRLGERLCLVNDRCYMEYRGSGGDG